MVEKDLKSRDIFYDYYVELTNILGADTACLLPGLIRERIISPDDQAVIESIPSPQAKAGKLLQVFSGPLEAGNKDSFVKLLQIMVNNGKPPTETLAKDILKKLNVEPIIVPRKGQSVHYMASCLFVYLVAPGTYMCSCVVQWTAQNVKFCSYLHFTREILLHS